MTNIDSKKGLTPPPIQDVKVTGGFWAHAQNTNANTTLPIEYEQCKHTGRIDAFRLDWTPDSNRPKPHYFWDSDVAKWIEGAAYSLSHHPDPKLQSQVDEVVDLIAAAQQADGYLNIYFSAVEPDKRWTNLRDWHELYCAGHLIEAAVAYYESSGKRKFLDVMCRYADYIDSIFGSEAGQMRGYPGHEEIELALVKLYRTTEENRYLELAQYFVDERGQQPHYYLSEASAHSAKSDWLNSIFDPFSYVQAHVPVREQSQIVGHAVRALYLFSGMADVAAETGDESLLTTLHRLWESITLKRMYITAGVGPAASNEGFTFDYDLPNETAYAETCAAIALVFFAQRMLNLEADSRYADVMERALYNGVISGISLQGDTFFYANPLAHYPQAVPFYDEAFATERQPWFECACCPPNICRLIGSFNQYIYSRSADALFVNLYTASTVSFTPEFGTAVLIAQETDYPWDDSITFRIDSPEAQRFTLALRLPDWCHAPELRLNGTAVEIHPLIEKGYVKLERDWQSGDEVALVLPMPVERILAHPSVRQNAGHVALQRGPLIYCLEEIDNGPNLHNLSLPWDVALSAEFHAEVLNGVTIITGKAMRLHEEALSHTLYSQASSAPLRSDVQFLAVPYYAWNNRGVGEMRIWIPAT